MKLSEKVLSFLLVLIIPVLVGCLAGNIVFRAPDLYQHEFQSTEILTEKGIPVEEEEMGRFFSAYMLWRIAEFQMEVDTGSDLVQLFTEGEQDAMQHFRNLLNILLIAAPVLLAAAAFIYWRLRSAYPEILRKRFFEAAVLFVLFIIGSIIAYLIPSACDFIYNLAFHYTPAEGDLLPFLLPRHFAMNYLVWGNIVSVIILVLFWYTTWKLTKPRRMFW